MPPLSFVPRFALSAQRFALPSLKSAGGVSPGISHEYENKGLMEFTFHKHQIQKDLSWWQQPNKRQDGSPKKKKAGERLPQAERSFIRG